MLIFKNKKNHVILPHGPVSEICQETFLLILLCKNKIHKNTCIESLFYEFLGVETVTTISLELCSLSPESGLYNIL